MKKLMLGMVAAAAMVACADVESSNIVGYGNNGLRFGYSLVASQFTAVGGGAASLDSLQGVGDDASDAVALAMVDEYGAAIATYTWNDWASDVPCWVDDSYEKVTGVNVVPGTAFWTSGTANTQSVQSSGEVNLNDVVVALRFGYTLTGNPFPVTLDLQDIVAESSSDSDPAADNVAVATIDEYGAAVATYTWNDWASDVPCWVDDSYEPVAGVQIAPGEGLWTSGTSEAQTIRFPAPEL